MANVSEDPLAYSLCLHRFENVSGSFHRLDVYTQHTIDVYLDTLTHISIDVYLHTLTHISIDVYPHTLAHMLSLIHI